MTVTRSAAAVFAVLAVAAAVGLAAVPVVVPAADDTGRSTGVTSDSGVPADYEFGSIPKTGHASVDGTRYPTLQAALTAAAPGDTVYITGTVTGPATVDTPNVTVAGRDGFGVVTGRERGTVLRVTAPNVTLTRLWVRDSGRQASANDAGIWLAGHNATVRDSRLTQVTFGIWVNGVTDARIANTTIVGRERVQPVSNRGNGIQLWRATDAVIENVRVTDARDGIYFSWSSGVLVRDTTLWDLRYGVHYMYSDRCRLVNNTAVGNDVGYALMLSQNLTLTGNRAINNTGRSGHGVLLKSVDRSTLRDNHLVGNDNGVFVYNSLDNTLRGNLVAGNDVGVHLTAGSTDERVVGNTFYDNDAAVLAVINERVAWNASGRGNYWGGARVRDIDHDGIGETRYRPAGVVQRLARTRPAARVYATSPAVRALQLAERTLPVVDTPGVVDHRPLAEPTANWTHYYDDTTR
ncbi:nitrous oxide reductase family maturation protein NosD [Halosegnis sp.]|uniref:nitrous oxide reductase family maturation protein NosD n=1 Tax=Halosegnis sp. TaxID=2864959 RepID=UPI0035D41FC0